MAAITICSGVVATGVAFVCAGENGSSQCWHLEHPEEEMGGCTTSFLGLAHISSIHIQLLRNEYVVLLIYKEMSSLVGHVFSWDLGIFLLKEERGCRRWETIMILTLDCFSDHSTFLFFSFELEVWEFIILVFFLNSPFLQPKSMRLMLPNSFTVRHAPKARSMKLNSWFVLKHSK